MRSGRSDPTVRPHRAARRALFESQPTVGWRQRYEGGRRHGSGCARPVVRPAALVVALIMAQASRGAACRPATDSSCNRGTARWGACPPRSAARSTSFRPPRRAPPPKMRWTPHPSRARLAPSRQDPQTGQWYRRLRRLEGRNTPSPTSPKPLGSWPPPHSNHELSAQSAR